MSKICRACGKPYKGIDYIVLDYTEPVCSNCWEKRMTKETKMKPKKKETKCPGCGRTEVGTFKINYYAEKIDTMLCKHCYEAYCEEEENERLRESEEELDTTQPQPINKHEGKKYLREIHSAEADNHQVVKVDVYCVLDAFGVSCPGRQQAIKKLLCAGQRGKGSVLEDLIGALAALNRAIELERKRGRKRGRKR